MLCYAGYMQETIRAIYRVALEIYEVVLCRT